MLNNDEMHIQAIPERKIIAPFDSNANFSPFLCHFISGGSPEFSREKKLENDFAWATAKDRFSNKFLNAVFEPHDKKVGPATVC